MKATIAWAGDREFSFVGQAYDLGGSVMDDKQMSVNALDLERLLHLERVIQVPPCI